MSALPWHAAALLGLIAALGAPPLEAEEQMAEDLAGGDAEETAVDPDADAPDQTAERERLAIIPTIYGDLRRVGALSEPALAPEAPSGALDWSLARSVVAWPGGSAPSSDGLRAGDAVPARIERRWDARLRAEQGVGLGMSLLATGSAARDDRTHAAHLGDPWLALQAPLWSSRYAACALTLAGGMPLAGASARDWLLDHGSARRGGWSGRVALAACGGIGLVALQARCSLEATPRGENAVRSADGATAIVRHRTAALAASLAATWRATTWLRAGAEAEGWQRRWRARDGDQLGDGMGTLRVEAAEAVLMAELTPLSGWSVRLDGGWQALPARLLRARDRVVAGAGVDWSW